MVEGVAVHPDCVAAYEEASALLASLGHEVEEVDLPFAEEAVPSFLALWFAMTTLARLRPSRRASCCR